MMYCVISQTYSSFCPTAKISCMFLALMQMGENIQSLLIMLLQNLVYYSSKHSLVQYLYILGITGAILDLSVTKDT
jgi:hypothetical protein